MEQERWELAADDLRLVLGEDPENSVAHSLLALCHLAREKNDEAESEAQQAIHLGPDSSFAYYVHARVLNHRNRQAEALKSIRRAIEIDPTDADYHSIEAAIHFDQREWSSALAAAESGLEFDPENAACNNLRAMALGKLGRRAEAGQTIEATLSRHPDSAVTHANRGWAYLEAGERTKALEHFREALRLDPTSDWARAGIVEALKAGNPLYGILLRYSFWMSSLSTRAQWAVVLGGYLGNRLLSHLASSQPSLKPWIFPIQIAYLVFAVSTWLADPIANLLLRLNRFGRLALSEEQTRSSNWVGFCFLMSALSFIPWMLSGFNADYLLGSILFFSLALPVASIWKCPEGWPRKLMTVYAATLAVVAMALLLTLVFDSVRWVKNLVAVYAIGIVGCPWFTNGLALIRPKR